MATARLPSSRELRLKMALIASLLTGVTTGCILLWLLPTLESGPEQRRFLAWAALILIGLTGPVAYGVQRRLCGAILEYLRRHREGEITPELRRAAFSQALRLPGALFKFALPCYPLAGLAGGGLAVLRFESWGAMDLTAIVLAASATGLIGQILAYPSYKAALKGVLEVLAEELGDPEQRRAAAGVLPLGRKLFVLVGAMTGCSAYFVLSLALGHASTRIEENAIVTHPRILSAVARDAEQSGDLEASLREAQRIYAAAGVRLSLLDPRRAGSETPGAANGLAEREVRYILSRCQDRDGPPVGNSIRYDSPNSFSWMVLPGDGRILAASTPREVIDSNLDALGFKIGSVAGVLVAISMLIAGLASRELRGAFTTLKRSIQRAASGDLRAGERFESEDEMGELARSLDLLFGSLRGIIGEVLQASSELEESAEAIASAGKGVAAVSHDQMDRIQRIKRTVQEIGSRVSGISDSARGLGESVEESSSSIAELGAMGSQLDESASLLSSKAQEASSSTEQMIQSIRQVARNTDALASQVQEVSHNADSMATSVRAVDGYASETAQLAQRVREASERGRDRVRQTIHGMEEIREATETAHQTIQSLGARTQEIGGILNVIDNVAAETSLLALNAAIIAAQAGEHGRAFAVVAGEVKGLATRVLSSTKEIAGVIHALQEESTSAVGAVERGVERVMTGVQLSAEAGLSLEEIESAASETDDRIAQIVAAVQQQREATERVVVVIEEILAAFSQIQRASQEHQSGSDHVLRNATEVGEVARQVHHTSHEQAAAAEHISHSMESIRDAVLHINAALLEHSSTSEQAVDSSEQLLEWTKTKQETADQMASATSELLERAAFLRKRIRHFRL